MFEMSNKYHTSERIMTLIIVSLCRTVLPVKLLLLSYDFIVARKILCNTIIQVKIESYPRSVNI